MSGDRTVAPDVLEAVAGATRRSVEVRCAEHPLREIEALAGGAVPRADVFCCALARSGQLNVIAECKRRSPSRGILRADYDPVAIARAYADAGAVALSVLTEPTFFDGSLEHLRAVRAAVPLPLLRKDFVVSEYQLVEARAAGADAALLIVALVSQKELVRLLTLTRELELAALVEVHDATELERALAAGATVVGINNRNLRTLAVDLGTAYALVERIPEAVLAVAESGLQTRGDLEGLRRAGIDAFLIGESLVTAPDPGGALRLLLGGA